MSGFKPYDPNSSGGGSDPTFTTLTEGQVPKADTLGKLVYAGATVNPATGVWTFDQSIEVPSASINVGSVVTLSEGSTELILSNNVDDRVAVAVTSVFDATGSKVPSYINLGPEVTFTPQGNDSEVITTNPIMATTTGMVTAPNTRQVNQTTFRAAAPMANVVAEIKDQASGVVIKYIPSMAAWNATTPEQKASNPGLDFIVGDNVINYVSEALDTPGVFNLGVSPFRIVQGQLTDITIRADAMALKGVFGVPYLSEKIQDGPPNSLSTQQYVDDASALLQPLSEKSQALGYASLDGGGKVPISELPNSVQGGVRVVGFWDADTNTPDLSALILDQGEAYQVSVDGNTNLNGETNWAVKDLAVWSDSLAGNWFKMDNTDDVLSVNSKTGVVVLDANDVGALQNGDNVSELTNDAGYLAAVATDATLTGDGTAGDPLSIAEDSVTVAQHRKMYGYDMHVDDTIKATAYTALDGVKTLIQNNAAMDMSDLDPSIGHLIGPSGGAILDQVNALYSIGIQFRARPDVRDKDYYLLFEIPDGVSPGVDLLISERFQRFAKQLQDEVISMSFVLPCTAATVGSEILPYIKTDATDLEYWATQMTVTKLNGPVIL